MKTVITKYLVVFVALFCFFGDASAAVWKQYATNNAYDYFFDAEDMRYPNTFISILTLKVARGDLVRVWSKKSAKGQLGRDAQMALNNRQGVTTAGYEAFGHSISQKEIQCNDKTVKVLSETDYTDTGFRLTGFSTLPEYARFQKIVPDTEDDALYKVVCGIVAPDRPIVVDDYLPRLPRPLPGPSQSERPVPSQTPDVPKTEQPLQKPPVPPAL